MSRHSKAKWGLLALAMTAAIHWHRPEPAPIGMCLYCQILWRCGLLELNAGVNKVRFLDGSEVLTDVFQG
eukprot:720888-Ditylum_brightwellii.AAC.1